MAVIFLTAIFCTLEFKNVFKPFFRTNVYMILAMNGCLW